MAGSAVLSTKNRAILKKYPLTIGGIRCVPKEHLAIPVAFHVARIQTIMSASSQSHSDPTNRPLRYVPFVLTLLCLTMWWLSRDEVYHVFFMTTTISVGLIEMLAFATGWEYIENRLPRQLLAISRWALPCAFLALTLLFAAILPRQTKLMHLLIQEKPSVLVVGEFRTEGFGLHVKQFLQENNHELGKVCVVTYMRTDDLGLTGPKSSGDYRHRLASRFAEYLSREFPQAIISADSSTTVSYLTDLAKKVAEPTIVVAATKGGVVSYADNIVRGIPPNLAQAQALAVKRRDIVREKELSWENEQAKKQVSDSDEQTQRRLQNLAAYKKYREELIQDEHATFKGTRPPKVLFGFVHDGSDFAIDLKGSYFALHGLDYKKVENNGTLVFKCHNESDMIYALTTGMQKGVAHWFVALYDKQAQDFHRAKTALESGVSAEHTAAATYCDSAYGEWMFGDTKKNAFIALPVYDDSKVARDDHPLYEGRSKDGRRLYRRELNRKENCYGPFAKDAICLVARVWADFRYSSGSPYPEFFYQNVSAPALTGKPILLGAGAFITDLRLYHYESTGPLTSSDDDEIHFLSTNSKQQEIQALEETPFRFQLFQIGARHLDP